MVYFDAKGTVVDCKTMAGFIKEKDTTKETKRHSLKRQYSSTEKNGFTIRRCISRFFNEKGDRCKYYIVNYKVLDAEGGDISLPANFFRESHGNSKSKENYVRTKPSVINSITEYGRILKPKQIVSAIQRGAGGVFAMKSASDVVRDRQQIYNKIKRINGRPKHRNTGNVKVADYTKVLTMAQDRVFVKNVSFGARDKDGML